MKTQVKKILVPIDFSPFWMQRLQQVAGLVKSYSAEIILMHVVERSTCVYNWTERPQVLEYRSSPQAFDRTSKARRVLLYRAIQLLMKHNLKVRSCLTSGLHYQEILKKSKEENIDLIIVPCSLSRETQEPFKSHLTDKLVQNSPCPVLTIPSSCTPEESPLFRND